MISAVFDALNRLDGDQVLLQVCREDFLANVSLLNNIYLLHLSHGAMWHNRWLVLSYRAILLHLVQEVGALARPELRTSLLRHGRVIFWD